ncbi:MAG: radical SAM protein, partial [Lachnospiraceae bacterium]|nr:radical SAM protein [Lachnospiraceae bacterium]
MERKNLSLYIHIPFCVKKCDYCDFLSFPATDEIRAAYVEALIGEIKTYQNTEMARRFVPTVFIGGGTPSVLSALRFGRILKSIDEVFGIDSKTEVSMELNPGTVTKEKCIELCKLGVNRFSIGLQSPEDRFLKKLGRIHNWEQFINTYRWLREAGAENINIDLMGGLPGQSVEEYLKGLHKVIELQPEHISAYSLIIEEGTPFYELYGEEIDTDGLHN